MTHLFMMLSACFLLAACGRGAAEQALRFSFSGGTGKVQIYCHALTEENGETTATLVFNSKNYQYIRVREAQYDRMDDGSMQAAGLDPAALRASYGDELSVFRCPAPRDGTLEINALTTAMSTPHEIAYTLYFGSAADAEEETVRAGDTGGRQTASFIEADQLPGLTLSGKTENSYAECFEIWLYEGGFRLINVRDSAQYLLVPEGQEAPAGLPEEIIVLQMPLDNIYLAATSVMSLFFAMDGQDHITLTGTDTAGWQIDGPAEAIQSGKMRFAGKYSAPDYELLVQSGCDLAIENTMILHAPDAMEKIEALGIPVFIDYSSYENHPLGRTEWIRLYGALCGREQEADAFFTEQRDMIEALEKEREETEQTDAAEAPVIAFFAVTTQGTVMVRRADDYIARMIEIAGGRYAFSDLRREDVQGGSETISMEEFYSLASEADILIFNATIEAPLKDVNALLAKDSLFADFRAVREDNVWQVGKNLYQATDIAGQLIRDIHRMLTGGDPAEMTFLEKLQ